MTPLLSGSGEHVLWFCWSLLSRAAGPPNATAAAAAFFHCSCWCSVLFCKLPLLSLLWIPERGSTIICSWRKEYVDHTNLSAMWWFIQIYQKSSCWYNLKIICLIKGIEQCISYTLGLRFKFALVSKYVIYSIMFLTLLTGYNHLDHDILDEIVLGFSTYECQH
jgi:hypothetical protein